MMWGLILLGGLMVCGVALLAWRQQLIHTMVNSNTLQMMSDIKMLTAQVIDLSHVNGRIEMTLSEYKRQMGPLAGEHDVPERSQQGEGTR